MRAFFVFLVLAVNPILGTNLDVPSKPALYFNDYASVVDHNTALQLNEKLAQYERESSNQIVVAIFSSLNGQNLEEFAARTFKSWGMGQKDKNNGVVLFVFINDHKMRIEVGYGLEGRLTDYAANRIIENIKPYFKQQDYAGGLRVGVDQIISANRGEYHGSGKTVGDLSQGIHRESEEITTIIWIIIIIAVLVFYFIKSSFSGQTYSRRGWYSGNSWSDSNSSSSGWSSWGGGGGGGGGFSGFSGGGGSSGGGGASGSW
jgi:uncharacterized protein